MRTLKIAIPYFITSMIGKFHHPKASMCAVCTHKARDCSHLDFSSMRPIERYSVGVDDLEIDWKGRSFILSEGEFAPTNPSVEYSFTPIKRDGSKAKSKKRNSVSMLASYCLFCGAKYARPE